jgi:hypothetical protein
VGRVKARRQQHEARNWAVRGGQTPRDSAAARPGSAGMRWERDLIGRAHASVRERERRCRGRKA